MLPAWIHGCYVRSHGKTSHVNAKRGDATDPTDTTGMSPRLLVTFLIITIVVVVSTLLSRYIGGHLSANSTGELTCLFGGEREIVSCNIEMSLVL